MSWASGFRGWGSRVEPLKLQGLALRSWKLTPPGCMLLVRAVELSPFTKVQMGVSQN